MMQLPNSPDGGQWTRARVCTGRTSGFPCLKASSVRDGARDRVLCAPFPPPSCIVGILYWRVVRVCGRGHGHAAAAAVAGSPRGYRELAARRSAIALAVFMSVSA